MTTMSNGMKLFIAIVVLGAFVLVYRFVKKKRLTAARMRKARAALKRGMRGKKSSAASSKKKSKKKSQAKAGKKSYREIMLNGRLVRTYVGSKTWMEYIRSKSKGKSRKSKKAA